MAKKLAANQLVKRRSPRQARAREKIELILEAASKLIDRDGLAALTTNRIADRAGVSIGTLYQYFPDKQAVVRELADRELKIVSSQVLAALTGPVPDLPGGRVRQIVRAAFGAFGGRSGVQRQLLERALATGRPPSTGQRDGLVVALLSGTGIVGHDGRLRQLTAPEAFVLTQAFTGVVRATLLRPPDALDRQAIEDALLRLVLGYFAIEDRMTGEVTAATSAAPARGKKEPDDDAQLPKRHAQKTKKGTRRAPFP